MQENNHFSSESRHHNFRRTLNQLHDGASSILSLALQWKEIEQHFESMNDSIERRAGEVAKREREVEERECVVNVREDGIRVLEREIEAKERKLERVFEELKLKEKEIEEERKVKGRVLRRRNLELDSKERKVEEKLRAIEVKEKEILGLCGEVEEERRGVEEKLRAIEVKEREIAEWGKEVELRRVEFEEGFKRMKKRFEEVGLRKKEVELKEMEIEGQRREVELRLVEFEEEFRKRFEEVGLREKEVEGQCREFEWKEKEIEGRQREVELKEKKVEGWCREVELKGKEVEGKLREVELKEKKVEGRCREVEKKGKEVERELREIELKEKNVKRCCREVEEKLREVELKVRNVERRCGEVEDKQREIELKEKNVERQGREVDEKLREVGLKEKKVEGWWREVELKEKQLEKESKEVKLKVGYLEKRTMDLQLNKKKFEEESKELNMKEKRISEWREEIELKSMKCEEDLRKKEDEVEKRLKEVELNEKELEVCCREVVLKGKQVEKQSEELKLKDEFLERRFMELQLNEKRFEEETKEFKLKEEQAKQLLELKENQILVKTMKSEEEFRKQEEKVEKRLKELELMDKQLQEQSKDLRMKHEHLKGRFTDLESNEKKFEEESKEFKLKQEKFEQKYKEVELNTKQVLEKHKEVELEKMKFIEQIRKKEDKVEEQFKELELKEKQLETRCREVEWKEKQLEGRCKGVELKKQNVIETLTTHVKSETLDDNVIDHPPADTSHCFGVKMDGKTLQIFLNECWKEHESEHDSMRKEVTFALKLSSDPAKLILDAMQGFYPPFLKKGDMEFKEDVVRRSCILLLEQLMKISPEINPRVKKEAMKIAFDWIAKMRTDTKHSLEVLGFLQLLASYGLASAFDADELLNYLGIVAHHNQAPELLRVLGFSNKISGFIQNLIRKNQLIEAIRLVYAFDMVDEFPPVPLLKDYLKHSRTSVKRNRRKNQTLEAQVEATNKRVADLRAVLSCIEDHKIKSDLSAKSLKQQIDFLEKQNSDKKTMLPSLGCKVESPHEYQGEQLAHKVSAAAAPETESVATPVLISPTNASTAGTASKTLLVQNSSIKRPWTAVSAGDDSSAFTGAALGASSELLHLDRNIDSSSLSLHPLMESISGKFSKVSFIKHEGSDSEPGENCNALQLEPAKPVLDKIKGLFSLDVDGDKDFFKSGVSEERCILLLEKLRKVSPQIGPRVKEEALNFAAEWIKNVKKRQGEVVIFLEFLVTYDLVSSFTSNDLLSLLDANLGNKKASDLCQVLGLVDKIPDFIQGLINRNQRIEAIKYIYVLKVDDKFPPVSLLHDHLSYSKNNAEKLCKEHNNSNVGQMEQLEMQKEEKRRKFDYSKAKVGPCTTSKSKSLQQQKKKSCEIIPAATHDAAMPAHTSVFPPSQAPSSTAIPAATISCPLPPTTSTDTLVPSMSLTLNAGHTASASYSVSPPASTSGPPSATIPKTKRQNHVQNKRRRVTVSSSGPNLKASFVDTSVVHAAQQFHQQPELWHANQCASYMPSVRHYSLSGPHQTNPQLSAYHSNIAPYHHWNNVEIPGYGGPPVRIWRL